MPPHPVIPPPHRVSQWPRLVIATMAIAIHCLGLPSVAQAQSLEPLWDTQRPLANPDKGWFHHYLDNSLWSYAPDESQTQVLSQIPGMNRLHLRLAWSFFERWEGVYDWSHIDAAHARYPNCKITLSVTCKETNWEGYPSDQGGYAVPSWVEAAGARGTWTEAWGHWNWTPDYGDPVFLAKLENFHRALAARYQGALWLDDIAIGSIGEWGEGHSSFSTNVSTPLAVRKQHIDLYKRCYPGKQITINDDLVHWGLDWSEAQDLAAYATANGLAGRDDSVLVDWYLQTYPTTASLAHQPWLHEVSRTRPVMLELQHYHLIKNEGNWVGTNGSIRGRDLLLEAIRLSRASHVGYHAWADQWLADNPTLAADLLNRMGYWFFPKSLQLPTKLTRGRTASVGLVWLNQGVAPCYQDYRVELIIGRQVFVLKARPSTWQPGTEATENYSLSLPKRMNSGANLPVYLRVQKVEADGRRIPIQLGLNQSTQQADGSYRIASVGVY